jgi:hypothetical protein
MKKRRIKIKLALYEIMRISALEEEIRQLEENMEKSLLKDDNWVESVSTWAPITPDNSSKRRTLHPTTVITLTTNNDVKGHSRYGWTRPFQSTKIVRRSWDSNRQ